MASSAMIGDYSGGLPADADLMMTRPPEPPFDWVREGTSFWLCEETGAFAIPRIGVEAEPHSWEQRRFAANFAFADGRVLHDAGLGAMPSVLDAEGRPAVLGGGPITSRCIEPFRRWHIAPSMAWWWTRMWRTRSPARSIAAAAFRSATRSN
jgi:prepilin-type processing-associated H-X9-DG protein